jgi:hypothetical protein
VTPEIEASFRGALSTEPTQRAFERIDMAARRGGLKGLVDATRTRIKATTSAEKLMGLVTMLSDLTKDLIDLKKAAERKVHELG